VPSAEVKGGSEGPLSSSSSSSSSSSEARPEDGPDMDMAAVQDFEPLLGSKDFRLGVPDEGGPKAEPTRPTYVQEADVPDDPPEPFLGQLAPPHQCMPDDPDEQARAIEDAVFAQEAFELLTKIESGKMSKAEFLELRHQHGKEAKHESGEGEGGNASEDDMLSNSDLDNRIDKLNHNREHQDGVDDDLSEDSYDSDIGRKKTKTFYFSRRGAKHPVYQAARALRQKRAKVFGTSHTDPLLPNVALTKKQFLAKKRTTYGFLEYDPNLVFDKSWYDAGGARLRMKTLSSQEEEEERATKKGAHHSRTPRTSPSGQQR